MSIIAPQHQNPYRYVTISANTIEPESTSQLASQEKSSLVGIQSTSTFAYPQQKYQVYPLVTMRQRQYQQPAYAAQFNQPPPHQMPITSIVSTTPRAVSPPSLQPSDQSSAPILIPSSRNQANVSHGQQSNRRTSGGRSLADAESKLALLSRIIDRATEIVASLSATAESHQQDITPTRAFVIHILKECQATMPTLVIALIYLTRLSERLAKEEQDSHEIALAAFTLIHRSSQHHHHPKQGENEADCTFKSPTVEECESKRIIARHNLIRQCGRRMFLAALCLAHKYLSETGVATAPWSTKLGLPLDELHAAETILMVALDHTMLIRADEYRSFSQSLMSESSNSTLSSPLQQQLSIAARP